MNPVWHFLNGVPQIGPLSIGQSAVTSSAPIRLADGLVGTPSLEWTSSPGSGLFMAFSDQIGIAINGSRIGRFIAGEYILEAATTLSWNQDTVLSRGAANLLQLATGDSFRMVSGVLYGGGLVSRLISVASINTAGVVAYTGAQIAGGLILRDCNGAGRADTVPTAADLLAAIPSAQVGQSIRFTIRNTSGGATSITVSTATGVTLSGTMTIAQNNSKDFLAVFTNVTAASEAYTLYSLGTVVF